jgi:methylenetetrahydrofolate dehydrogenase (NADP+)/methenyltetrahydrofolate cyclohydrolase
VETRILDGRAVAAQLRQEVAARIRAAGSRPTLAVVLVGDDPASHLYVSLKERACAEAGIGFEKRLFPAGVPQDELVAAVGALGAREDVDAVLVQLPLPAPLDADAVVAAVDPAKDADGFHPENLKAYLEGRGPAPALVEVIDLLLDVAAAPHEGLACVLAKSPVFTLPVETMLERRGLSPTEDVAAADVIVTALGKPGSLTRNLVKPGAIVIDVGTTRVGEKTLGDVDLEGLRGHAGAITPVPGGVGPLTVAMLLKRVDDLAERRQKK